MEKIDLRLYTFYIFIFVYIYINYLYINLFFTWVILINYLEEVRYIIGLYVLIIIK